MRAKSTALLGLQTKTGNVFTVTCAFESVLICW